MEAKNYMDRASSEIKNITISRKQQHDLFLPIYESMVSEVLRISKSTEALEKYGALNWSNTNKKIQDVTVDLIYRGDYTRDTRIFLQTHIINNDIPRFSETIRSRSNWPTVPLDRFNKRSQHLENNR
ncbi:hypothetical protein [Pseudomonas sp. ok602]|uniref:hypothetical protein n=1 Tax=Pseudomonas sp. ok602 TaxID=1761898 RepID=UPI002115279F|nr:hypothetical protein [Pseudomonas sp. ok602]